MRLFKKKQQEQKVEQKIEKKKEQEMTDEQFRENVEKYFFNFNGRCYRNYVYCDLKGLDYMPHSLLVEYKDDNKKWYVGGVVGDTIEQATFSYLIGLRREQKDISRKWYDDYYKTREEFYDYKNNLKITKIVHNKKKEATVVEFGGKDKVIVHKAKGVKSDIYTAVAFAIVKRMFENNSHFQKFVDEMVSDKWNNGGKIK